VLQTGQQETEKRLWEADERSRRLMLDREIQLSIF